MTPRLPVIQVHYFQRFQQHWNMPMNISDSRNSTFCTCTFCTFYNVIWISRMLLALNWIFRPLEFNHPPMYKNCPFKLISRVILEWTLSAVSTYIYPYTSIPRIYPDAIYCTMYKPELSGSRDFLAPAPGFSK